MIHGGFIAGAALAALTTFSLVSYSQEAEEITSVKIWHDSERAKVYDDYRFAPGTVIEVFDFALQRQTNQQLNDALVAQGVQYTADADENMNRAQDALGQYMQGEAFEQLEAQYQQVGLALKAAFVYQVDKAPTIIINEQYRLVGISSLKEAASIYHREVR